MSERSPNWTALAIGIGLFGAMLVGCRTRPAPMVSSVPEPMPISATAEPAADNGEHSRDKPDTGRQAAITKNLQDGEFEESRGRPAQAAEYYQRILRIDPRHAEAHQRLARIATAGKDYRQAERHLRAALEEYPYSRELWTELARCCAAQNRPRDARRALQRAVGSANPGRAVAGPHSQQRTPAAHDERSRRIILAPLPPRAEKSHQTPAIIVRTAQASSEMSSENPARTSVENPQRHKLPLLPGKFVQQARAQGVSPAAIHLVSLTPDESVREAARLTSPKDSRTTVSDGNLPLWEGNER